MYIDTGLFCKSIFALKIKYILANHPLRSKIGTCECSDGNVNVSFVHRPSDQVVNCTVYRAYK